MTDTQDQPAEQPMKVEAELRVHLSLSIREYRRMVDLLKLAITTRDQQAERAKDQPASIGGGMEAQSRMYLSLINDQTFLETLMRAAGPLTVGQQPVAMRDDPWFNQIIKREGARE